MFKFIKFVSYIAQCIMTACNSTHIRGPFLALGLLGGAAGSFIAEMLIAKLFPSFYVSNHPDTRIDILTKLGEIAAIRMKEGRISQEEADYYSFCTFYRNCFKSNSDLVLKKAFLDILSKEYAHVRDLSLATLIQEGVTSIDPRKL